MNLTASTEKSYKLFVNCKWDMFTLNHFGLLHVTLNYKQFVEDKISFQPDSEAVRILKLHRGLVFINNID